MAILKIARLGHPVLREKARPIDPKKITGPEVQALIRDMYASMIEYNGIGLAAPQVHTSLQLALVGGEEDEEGRPLIRVVINPEVEVLSDKKFGMYEGCLSVPGLRGYVERPSEIRVKFYDGKGRRVEIELEGYPAVVMQHECDHLQGVLYVDRIEDMTKLVYEEEGERFLPVGEFIDGSEDDSLEEAAHE